MTKQDREDALVQEFVDFADEYPQSALSLITSLFVGLLENAVEEQNGDRNQQITIDGGPGKRSIVLMRRNEDRA